MMTELILVEGVSDILMIYMHDKRRNKGYNIIEKLMKTSEPDNADRSFFENAQKIVMVIEVKMI